MCISVGLFCQVQHSHLPGAPVQRNAACVFVGVGYIGIHARAADFLSEIIHNDNIQIVKQNTRHELTRQCQIVRFLIDDLLRRQRDDLIRHINRIFNDCQTQQYIRVLQNGLAEQFNGFAHFVSATSMYCLRAILLSQPDGHHFEQAAFIPASEPRVTFDAVDQDDAVCLGGITIDVHGCTVRKFSDFDGFHRRPDGSSHRFLGDAIARQNIALSIGGCASVATHGRNQKWIAAAASHKGCRLAQHILHAENAAASCGNRYAHSRANLFSQNFTIHGSARSCSHIRQRLLRQMLPDARHRGDWNAIQNAGNCVAAHCTASSF